MGRCWEGGLLGTPGEGRGGGGGGEGGEGEEGGEGGGRGGRRGGGGGGGGRGGRGGRGGGGGGQCCMTDGSRHAELPYPQSHLYMSIAHFGFNHTVKNVRNVI